LNSDVNTAPHAIADWYVLWLKSRIWNLDHITIFQRKKRTFKITHRCVGSQDSWHLKTALQTCQKGREKYLAREQSCLILWMLSCHRLSVWSLTRTLQLYLTTTATQASQLHMNTQHKVHRQDIVNTFNRQTCLDILTYTFTQL
jgi:hypothetical protein